MDVELETEQLIAVDWSRHSISFAPALHDQEQSLKRGGINFTIDEMKVLRMLLSREVAGTELIPVLVYENLRTFVQALTAMEQWSVDRRMP